MWVILDQVLKRPPVSVFYHTVYRACLTSYVIRFQLPFFTGMVSVGSRVGSSFAPAQKVKSEVPMFATYVCAGFGFVGFLVFHTVAERESSSVLTMSALAQCLGIAMLCVQSFTSGKAEGISAASLMLDSAAICLRLSSTLWLDGYLPTDKTGEWPLHGTCNHSPNGLSKISHQSKKKTMRF